ncbi:MAG TPA: AMP-binding protein [Solirubrobacterales bacterium]|jgi:acyl-CoA synthetase (AMP-forming)/AMP-acid ligase II|nr:AMP-binding protein [Solirubrobacterales bacterium]
MKLFESLLAAKTSTLRTFENDASVVRSWNEVIARGHRMATGLRRRGLGQRRVPCVLTNGSDVLSGMLGIWLAGGTIASLPVPARAMDIGEYADQQAAICDRLGTATLMMERPLIGALQEALGDRVELLAWDELEADRPCEPEFPGEEEPAFIQFSSGSTGFPKGCVLTTAAVGTQLQMIANTCRLRGPEEVAVSWLPLSHDMGTFGAMLSSWAFDMNLILSSPARFVRDPRTWFEDCARFGAGLTTGPPAALRAALRAQATRPLPGPLQLRVCVLGAEQIPWSLLLEAREAYAPFGLRPEVWMPAYGMAEATLMVTAVDADERPSAVHLDSAALAEGQIGEAREGAEGTATIVSLGRGQGGARARASSAEGLSEIKVSSPSLASGYFGNHELSAERFRDGEFASGDRGFIRDGCLYLVGREDDMLSVAGRNVFVGEIEAAIDIFDGVRSGCSTLIDIGRNSRSSLVMLLELKHDDIDYKQVATAASKTAKAKAGILIDECVFLPKGSLPKTPSGKVQRFRCRHLLASEEFEPVQRVRLRRVVR